MTLRRGEDWGRQGPMPEAGVVVASDAAAREVVTAALAAGGPIPPLGLIGGDLARSLGARGDPARLTSESAHQFHVDLGTVLIDGEAHHFVAHLVARRALWAGRFVMAMNTEYLGEWKLAPRAHPGDGRLDLLDGRLALGDRLKARSRLPRGDHLPHPAIRSRQVTSARLELERATTVRLDGQLVGRARVLELRVEPGAVLCIV